MNETEEHSPKRFAIASVTCPACHKKLDRDANWCGGCGFTGAKSLEMFGDSPPPLLPILDAVDLWDKKSQKRISTEVKSFCKRFPQIKWRVCAVALGPEVSLPLFGFWLMNVCPLNAEETAEEREWTVLLLIDGNTGRASVTTGYRAEVWLSNEMWSDALLEVTESLRRGRADQAVVLFLRKARGLFENAWKRTQKQLSAR